jgi:KUP system potassium uptake protein
VIASQALISVVFSLTQQAIDLGYCPRLLVVHTSSEIKGQIYVPAVNYALMVACLAVVIAFRESSGLAGAYGISVTGTMNITSTLFFLLATRGWGWPVWKAAPLVILFLIFDSSYFLANLLKIVDGGWFTLFIAALITLLLTTWRRGRSELYRKLGTRLPMKVFLEDLARHDIPRVKGTAVFLSVNPEGTSPVLLHHLKHTKVLHERVILLSMKTANRPSVKASERVEVEGLGQGFFSVAAHSGFMQRPNVPEIMKMAERHGLQINPAETTFYLGRVTLFTHGDSKMMLWRKTLFAFMARAAGSPTAYFNLPADRVVELGAQVQL